MWESPTTDGAEQSYYRSITEIHDKVQDCLVEDRIFLAYLVSILSPSFFA